MRLFKLLLAFLVGITVPPVIRAQTVSQSAIATRLLSADRQVRMAAFQEARAIPTVQVSEPLRTAFLELVRRHNDLIADANRTGSIVSTREDPEFISRVAQVVAQFRDARAIPLLAEASAGGKQVRAALAEFGEAAVPALKQVASSSGKHYDVVDHAIRSLILIVDRTGGSLATRGNADIRDVVRLRLKDPGYFTTLWHVMDLALALGDSEFRNAVDSLAANPDAIRARGISEPEVVARTQRRAQDLLAARPARTGR